MGEQKNYGSNPTSQASLAAHSFCEHISQHHKEKGIPQIISEAHNALQAGTSIPSHVKKLVTAVRTASINPTAAATMLHAKEVAVFKKVSNKNTKETKITQYEQFFEAAHNAATIHGDEIFSDTIVDNVENPS